MSTTKTVHASFEYEVGGRKVIESISMAVPSDSPWYEWRTLLGERASEIAEAKGAENVFLRFRLDGSDQPLAWWQHVIDWLSHTTWRGTPYTGNHFVPIWPSPAG